MGFFGDWVQMLCKEEAGFFLFGGVAVGKIAYFLWCGVSYTESFQIVGLVIDDCLVEHKHISIRFFHKLFLLRKVSLRTHLHR